MLRFFTATRGLGEFPLGDVRFTSDTSLTGWSSLAFTLQVVGMPASLGTRGDPVSVLCPHVAHRSYPRKDSGATRRNLRQVVFVLVYSTVTLV